MYIYSILFLDSVTLQAASAGTLENEKQLDELVQAQSRCYMNELVHAEYCK